MEIAEVATQPKRLRQDCQGSSPNPNDDTFLEDVLHHEDSAKRLKPYKSILNLLDDDDDDDEKEPSDQDLSAMFTTLQRELASSPSSDDRDQQPRIRTSKETSDDYDDDDLSRLYYIDDLPGGSSVAATSADEDDEDVRSLMRDLLEASDDELGIPNCINNDHENNMSSSDDIDQSCEENMVPFGLSSDHVFWEIEDEAANYYTVLQSQLFM